MWNCSVMADSLRPCGLYSPRDSPVQNTGVGSHSLLQGIFPTQGLSPGLLHFRQILYQLSHQGSSRILEWGAYPFSRGSSQPRNWTRVSCIAGGFFTSWATWEAQAIKEFLLGLEQPKGGHNQIYVSLLFWKCQPRHKDQKKKKKMGDTNFPVQIQEKKKRKLAKWSIFYTNKLTIFTCITKTPKFIQLKLLQKIY